jgi:hypothetical protein
MLLKRWYYVLFGLIVVIAISGCHRPHKMSAPFDEREFLPYLGLGTSTIKGQAFLKTRGGEVKYGAGNPVWLVPVTSYTKELWEASLYNDVIGLDPRWKIYNRSVIADASGNFEFKNIPAGEYHISCSIFWEVFTKDGPVTTGAVVKKQRKVRPNETLRVMLTE